MANKFLTGSMVLIHLISPFVGQFIVIKFLIGSMVPLHPKSQS